MDLDISNNRTIKRILLGLKKSRPTSDTRLPITPHILSRLILALERCPFSRYNKKSPKSDVFYRFFFGFFRISEITHDTAKPDHDLKISDLKHSSRSDLLVSLSKYKHNSYGFPSTITISKTGTAICPISAIRSFLSIRPPSKHKSLFIFKDGTPVPRTYFANSLRRCIVSIGLAGARYRSHSFRIGAATHAAEIGISDDQIRRMGRWKSNAFLKYIRSPSLN